ncbi:MAG: dihydroorotase [Vallitaleaceae bacterium]|nr:dihydroorotase [Vallitaleaceae bacterium]
MKIIIKHGRIIDPSSGRDEISDILVERGKIKKIGHIPDNKDATIIDAKGCWVTPGLIDVHVHLREPGYEYKEDIESGTLSAVAGGFTTVCCMPNTKPVIDSPKIIKHIIKKAKEKGHAHVLPIGAITLGQKGEVLAPIDMMVDGGAIAISEDGRSVLNAKILKTAMFEAARLNIPVLSHCEDDDLAHGGCMNDGKRSRELGLSGIPNDAEDIITARDILLAKSTGAKLHLCHVSTAGSVDLIREAKSKGIQVTAEVCPHHFTLTDEAVDGQDANMKMNPPLRTQADVDAIIEGLKDGTIDIIATDHAPHAPSEKESGFISAANGIVGLETALGLSLHTLVRSGLLTPSQLIEKMSLAPAKLLGIDKGSLKEGKMADITIIQPEEVYVIDKNTFKSKGRNTPYDGVKVTGKVKYTLVKGVIKYDDNENQEA